MVVARYRLEELDLLDGRGPPDYCQTSARFDPAGGIKPTLDGYLVDGHDIGRENAGCGVSGREPTSTVMLQNDGAGTEFSVR
jgi:hypothetical protein